MRNTASRAGALYVAAQTEPGWQPQAHPPAYRQVKPCPVTLPGLTADLHMVHWPGHGWALVEGTTGIRASGFCRQRRADALNTLLNELALRLTAGCHGEATCTQQQVFDRAVKSSLSMVGPSPRTKGE